MNTTVFKPIFFIVFFNILIAHISFAQQEKIKAAPANSKVEQQIRDLDQQRFKAMIANDQAALSRILSDDLIYTHSNGRVETKAEFMNSISSGRSKYQSVDTEDVVVRMYGTTAIVTGQAHVKINSNGNDLDLKLRYMDVYAKQNGRWQMVAWQSTRIAVQ